MKKWEIPSMEMLEISETAHGFIGCGEDGCFVSCHTGHKIPIQISISFGPISISRGEEKPECGQVDDLS